MKKNIKTFCFSALTILILVFSASAEGTWTNYTNGNYIRDIAVEGDYIWCATIGGVVRWNRRDGTYIKYTTVDGLANNYVIAAAIDADNVKWFGTDGGGVSSYDGTTWTTFTTGDGLVSNFVYSIAVDADNVKWFGTFDKRSGRGSGVSSFDGTTWKTYKTYTPEFGLALASNSVWAIAVDADNVKWFGTFDSGVSSFDGTTWTTYTTEDGLAHNWVRTIAIDADNVKWFGTLGGVSSFDGTIFTSYTEEDGLAYNDVRAVASDFYNVKWFGMDGGGVSSFDGTKWTTYTTEDGLADNEVLAIAVDDDNVKWFGTYSGGVSSFDKGAFSVENLRDIPAVMDIRGNFPNPFNPSTTIEFSLDTKGFVKLDICNITGQKINTLFAKNLPAGTHSVVWNGSDAIGSTVSSGIYFCRLVMDDFIAVHRMVLVK